LFPVLIGSWRKLWGQGDFPFLYVQLPTLITHDSTNNWAALRESQTMTLRVTNTAMAVTMDNPDPASLHPWNKPDVGKRLALNALSLVYGQNVVCTGPRFKSMTVEGNKIRVRLSDIGSGMITKNNEPVKGFAVAGKDRVFALAQATMEPSTGPDQGNDSVVVWADSVREPVAVRYAWADAPICNLFNKEGLPAWPFRTDNWDDVRVWPTEGQR
jgi:sialate O-acetylesterase